MDLKHSHFLEQGWLSSWKLCFRRKKNGAIIWLKLLKGYQLPCLPPLISSFARPQRTSVYEAHLVKCLSLLIISLWFQPCGLIHLLGMLSCSDIALNTVVSHPQTDRTDTQRGLHTFIEHPWLPFVWNSKCELSLHSLLPLEVNLKNSVGIAQCSN